MNNKELEELKEKVKIEYGYSGKSLHYQRGFDSAMNEYEQVFELGQQKCQKNQEKRFSKIDALKEINDHISSSSYLDGELSQYALAYKIAKQIIEKIEVIGNEV